jgi:hypothetical protein
MYAEFVACYEATGQVKMLADPLTKGLPPSLFKEHVAGMGLRDSL